MKFDNLTTLFIFISCSKVRGSLFLSIQKQESSALFSTYISEGKFYIRIFWQSSWKKKKQSHDSFLVSMMTYTTGRNEIQRCVFRFRTFNLNPSWILSQLSYERVLYIKSFVYASLFDCKNKIGKICTVRETINRTTR